MKDKKKCIILFILVFLAISILLGVYGLITNSNRLLIKEIRKNIRVTEDKKIEVVVKIDANKRLTSNEKIYCAINKNDKSEELDWKLSNKKECSWEVEPGEYNIYLKDKEGFTIKSDIQKVDVNRTLNIETPLDIYYIPVNTYKTIDAKVDYIGKIDDEINWKSDNENIVSVNNNVIYGESLGQANIVLSTKDGYKKDIKVVVTDLIVSPRIDKYKPKLPCNRYSETEAEMMDLILESRIKEAGEGTRAGVVAAARFLLLEFPYTLKYFNENGRLVNHSGQSYVDGEGRYYHKGLYLHENKFSAIIKSRMGPAIWGCKLYDLCLREYRPNGFTCSGFVSWTLLNGGFDVGDAGAGDYSYRSNDLSDLGERVKISKELVNSGKIKVGDIAYRNGHVAVIIGLDENNIYIAESLPGNVKVVTLNKYGNFLTRKDLFTHVIFMDSVYKNEGNYTNMW